MGFEKFTQTGRSFTPKVSIWSRGQIGFNKGAVKRFDLGKFNYVVFFYDKDTNRIGIKPIEKAEEGAVTLNQKTTGAAVGAKAFLDFYDIDYKETRQYNVQEDKENNLLVIDLNETTGG